MTHSQMLAANAPELAADQGSRLENGSDPLEFVAEAYAAAALLEGAAKFIDSVSQLYRDIAGTPGKELVQTLRDIHSDLNRLHRNIEVGFAAVLTELGVIRDRVDADAMSTGFALSDTGCIESMRLGRLPEAQEYTYQGVRKIIEYNRSNDPVYALAFMRVVNNRLAVVKTVDPEYFCPNKPFLSEFRSYWQTLSQWIGQVGTVIASKHSVEGPEWEAYPPDSHRPRYYRWVAHYLAWGTYKRSEFGPRGDRSDQARSQVLASVNASMRRGIAADRRRLSVTAMEETAAAWQRAFANGFRQSLVSELLNRPAAAGDFIGDQLLVDGRLIQANVDGAPDLDVRRLLLELLGSPEFRARIERSWTSFINREDDRLVQVAYRRLFEREPTDEETDLLRQVASRYGYRSYIAALLHSDEYERRYGHHAPTQADSAAPAERILEALEGPGAGALAEGAPDDAHRSAI